MMRVGLTGGLGSGKSAVGLVLAEGGAHVLEADAIGRELMQPGRAVYRRIVEAFGAAVVNPDGSLDRRALAVEAFENGRLAELNAIVHPAVLRAQDEALRRIEVEDPSGIAVVESALIFEVARDAEASGGANPKTPAPGERRRERFDRLILVTAPDHLKVERYVERVAPAGADAATRAILARNAEARLAAQIPDAEKAPRCDYVIENSRTLVLLRREAQAVWRALQAEAASRR